MSLLCSPFCQLRIKAIFLFLPNSVFIYFIPRQWAEKAKILASNISTQVMLGVNLGHQTGGDESSYWGEPGFLPEREVSGACSGVMEVLTLPRKGWDTSPNPNGGDGGSPADATHSGISIYTFSSQFSGFQVFPDSDLGIADLSQLSIWISRDLCNFISSFGDFPGGPVA